MPLVPVQVHVSALGLGPAPVSLACGAALRLQVALDPLAPGPNIGLSFLFAERASAPHHAGPRFADACARHGASASAAPQAATTVLYKQMYERLGLAEFETERSRLWRATLNSILLDLPEIVRTAYFGHDMNINRSAYTDRTAVSSMVAAARRLIEKVTARSPAMGLRDSWALT